MYIYTSDKIKEIDQEAELKGMSLFALMENAGSGLYKKIAPLLKKTDKIVIFAGRGNNGGDGIVLARYLKNNGFYAQLMFPLGEPKTKTAQEHLAYYQACGYNLSPFTKDCQADWMIDALLGVGSQLPLKDDLAELTEWMKTQVGRKISIDVPTGVAADDGAVDEHAVCAEMTFSLHGYKPSAFLFPSSEYYGELSVVDIGVPQSSHWRIWSEADVRETLPKESGNTHKGTFGTTLLVAGSDEMPGSAALAAIGALRFGTGKLTIATTKHASTIIGPLAPEATFTYDLQSEDLDIGYSSIGIGPGLIPDQKLEHLITDMLKIPVPVVLDAGAINKRNYQRKADFTIMTPHPGEFRRLTGKSTNAIQRNRIRFASEYAVEHQVIVVLKGKYTVIAFPDGTGFINSTGNRALSKGGTGDTLTGMLLASIGTHELIKEAVANAVFLHGACADEWILENGEQTMLAQDFDRLLPKVCKKFSKRLVEKA